MQAYRSEPKNAQRFGGNTRAMARARQMGGMLGVMTALGIPQLDANIVEVNSEQLQIVMANVLDPLERPILDKLVDDAICPFDIQMLYGEETVELPESEQQILALRWPMFVRDMLRTLMAAGIVIVRIDRESRLLSLPCVVPFRFVLIKFRESATEARQYHVEDVKTGAPLDVLIFVRFPPDSDGNLTSPGATVVNDIARVQRADANHDEGDFNRTHPIWATSFVGTTGHAAPSTSIRYDSNELLNETSRYFQRVLKTEVTNQQLLSQAHTQRWQAINNELAADPSQPALPAGVAFLPPWARNFTVPPNQKLDEGPRPELDPAYLDTREACTRSILQNFGVPAAVMDQGRAKDPASAQSVMGFRMWQSKLIEIQAQMAPLIEQIYLYANSDIIDTYIKIKMKASKDARMRMLDAVEKRVQAFVEAQASKKLAARQLRRRRRKQAAASAAAAARLGEESETAEGDVEADDEGESSDSDESAEENDDDVPVVYENDQGNLQIGETMDSLLRMAEVSGMSTDVEEAVLRAKFTVVVTFNAKPAVTYEELQAMYVAGIISREEFARAAAAIMGLSEDVMLLDIDDAIKDAKERKRIMDILEPPEQKKPAAPGGSAKPAAKKAAAAKPKSKPKPAASKAGGKAAPSRPKPKNPVDQATTLKRLSEQVGQMAKVQKNTIDQIKQIASKGPK